MTNRGVVRDILTRKEVKDHANRPYFLLEYIDGTYRVAYQAVCPSFYLVLCEMIREMRDELVGELMPVEGTGDGAG